MQVGEFQCYDRRALASLAAAAQEAGHPEWGYMGPHDAGHYNSMPEVGPVASGTRFSPGLAEAACLRNVVRCMCGSLAVGDRCC